MMSHTTAGGASVFSARGQAWDPLTLKPAFSTADLSASAGGGVQRSVRLSECIE